MRGGPWPVRWRPASVPLLVFAVAFGTRVATVLCRGGYGGYFNYDSGVYYSAASALLHGRLPYRDFILVHPPGSTVALTPFAALGAVTSDHVGYTVANLASSALGAAAAALVVMVVRELVPSSTAALAAGMAYAVYPGAVLAETQARLEPFGNAALLLGTLCLLRAPVARRRVVFLGGAALVAAVSVKIWYVVPAAFVLLTLVPRGRRGRWRPVAAGSITAVALIDLPFFLAAPRAMVRAVVLAQLGRPEKRGTGSSVRLSQLSGVPLINRSHPPTPAVTLVIAIGTVVPLLVVVALTATRRGARPFAVMLLAQATVLLTAPSYYAFYTDYLAPAGTICLGVALGVVAAAVSRRAVARRPLRRVAAATTALVAAAAVLALTTARDPVSGPYPAARFGRAVAASRCVMSNNPEVLIQLDALDRGLAAGCRNRVDYVGWRLLPRRYPSDVARAVATKQSEARYLLSGDAVALLAGETVAMNQQLERVLGNAPVLARSGTLCVVRITARQRREYRDLTPLPRVSPPGATAAERAATAPWCDGPLLRSR